MKEYTYKIVEKDPELKGAYEVRRQVFSVEQGIAEELVFSGDEDDDKINMVAMYGEEVIGTARVSLLADNTAKIERMAVIKSLRHKGIGKGIMAFLDEEFKRRQIEYVFLHGQHTVVDFYRSCGFSETGEPFYEAGIKHIKMERRYQ